MILKGLKTKIFLIILLDKNDTKYRSKEKIEKIYLEDCFKELYGSSLLTYHFAKKGTTLEGLLRTKCGYDDHYFRVQCPDCNLYHCLFSLINNYLSFII